jgi:hypothetical protein
VNEQDTWAVSESPFRPPETSADTLATIALDADVAPSVYECIGDNAEASVFLWSVLELRFMG